MKFIRNSSLNEYARVFWKRQRSDVKNDPNDNQWITLLQNESDPVDILRKAYQYKLPFEGDLNVTVDVYELDEDDLAELTISEDLVGKKWFVDNHLTPPWPTNRNGDLAKYFIEQNYFNRPSQDSAQWKNYNKWKESGLQNLLTEDMPLIQYQDSGEYRIVDGWGRLLAYAALCLDGWKFYPVPCFVAKKFSIQE
jgi:hypothetical protein